MTREKLKRAVALGVRRARGRETLSEVDLVVEVVDAIEVALELEMDGGEEAKAPIDFPFVDRVEEERPAQGAAPPLPQSPAVSQTPRLIITPQEAAAEANKPPAPEHHVISSLVRVIEEEGKEPRETRAWQLEVLLEKLHAVTPEEIGFEVDVPEQGIVPVKLSRNIIAGHGFGAVKVSYKHDAVDESLAVFETVMLDDYDVDITEMMRKIKTSAKHAYRPRQKTIVSKTPARTGEMSFDINSTPHAETDVLTTSSGEKY